MKKPKVNRDEGEYEYCPGCGKRIFLTKGAAERAVADIKRKRKGDGSVYQCPDCGHYHTTQESYSYARERHRSHGDYRARQGLEGHYPTHTEAEAKSQMEVLEILHRMNARTSSPDEWWGGLTLLMKCKIFEVMNAPSTARTKTKTKTKTKAAE